MPALKEKEAVQNHRRICWQMWEDHDILIIAGYAGRMGGQTCSPTASMRGALISGGRRRAVLSGGAAAAGRVGATVGGARAQVGSQQAGPAVAR